MLLTYLRGNYCAANGYCHRLNDGVILWNRIYSEYADENNVVSAVRIHCLGDWDYYLWLHGILILSIQ